MKKTITLMCLVLAMAAHAQFKLVQGEMTTTDGKKIHGNRDAGDTTRTIQEGSCCNNFNVQIC